MKKPRRFDVTSEQEKTTLSNMWMLRCPLFRLNHCFSNDEKIWNFSKRHNDDTLTSWWRHTTSPKFKCKGTCFLFNRKNIKFCILWCLYWLSSAICRRVIAENVSVPCSGTRGPWIQVGQWTTSYISFQITATSTTHETIISPRYWDMNNYKMSAAVAHTRSRCCFVYSSSGVNFLSNRQAFNEREHINWPAHSSTKSTAMKGRLHMSETFAASK